MSETKQKPPYPLRMPDGMKSALQDAANKRQRSLNAEIVDRLEMSLLMEGHRSAEVSDSPASEKMTKVVMEAFDRWYENLKQEGEADEMMKLVNKKDQGDA